MNNNSKVLALKYRPQVFKDLIGQEIVAQTIYNAIKFDKSPNAYLFTGIRGVGKTTFARIVAKSLNCEKGIDKLCSKDFCQHCLSIINSNHIDVLEIDAASKTGVDDVRDLIEFSRYSPSIAKFKIFIIDEVHMLSKQAFNALLKTLEEPPKYLKFIFATTEIKKIPVTIVSRSQRFDLSRVSFEKLFEFLKKIKELENGMISDEALKLIVKISEGSVRDSLSLLDRALIANETNNELSLSDAYNIFGYTDKSSYIELLDNILVGDESSVLNRYKEIYNSGVEARIFLNDFLEILFYLKNISSLKVDGKLFSLNDIDYKKILSLSRKIEPKAILLFWEYTIKTIQEINLVTNQNIAVEMFLIKLLYLKNKKIINTNEIKKDESSIQNLDHNLNSKTVNQIKSVVQKEEQIDLLKDKNIETKSLITNIDELINLCNNKRELKLKYELENNVKLVSFKNNTIEIEFNEKLDKYFVKDLSEKLFQWTQTRWLISFSRKKGEAPKKIKEKALNNQKIDNFKKSSFYTELNQLFPDIEITEITEIDDLNN